MDEYKEKVEEMRQKNLEDLRLRVKITGFINEAFQREKLEKEANISPFFRDWKKQKLNSFK